MQRIELEQLSRKELQALAKTHGIKANLSNNDIINKLCDAEQPVESATAPTPVESQETEVHINLSTEAEPSVAEAVVEMQVIPVLPNEKVSDEQPEIIYAPVEPSAEYFPAVGDTVEADIDGMWVHASVKRLNKKTARVVVTDSGKEFTLKFSEMRPVSEPTAEPETISSQSLDIVVKEAIEEPVVEAVVSEETIVEEVAEVAIAAIEGEAMDVEAAAEVIALEQEAVAKTSEDVEPAEPTPAPLAIIRVDYLEPLSCPRAPPTPVSCARPSKGWNSCTKFSLEDSAVKSAAGPSSRRKERRKARRSAMKQLAESMKLEGMEVVAEPELQNEAQMAIESTPLVVPAPIVSVATTVTAPVAPTAGAPKEMFPRMNKAQLMRVGAIQKKIVSTEMVPPASTAFTIAAKTASAATPAQARHSISAPSSVAASARAAPLSAAATYNSAARPALKVATPLSGPTNKQTLSSRASIAGGSAQQISGLKRKLDSSDRSSSVHSNAPDFKRMHSKQFGSLKSITECVEQDKHVGVRMTIAMESAMTSSASKEPPTTSANPSSRLSTIAEVPKPAANPFNKVINKSGTPAKAAATPAPLALSRPTTGINTSANIVKSRTVTSFVNGSCASGGAGQKVASFLNNENEKPSGNSFLKSKDMGSGSAKHRSVSMSGSNFGHTQQKLQML